MPKAFLALSKFQKQLLDEHFNERGNSEGYQRTYQRLKLIIKDKTHYAMNKYEEIARADGEIFEEVGQLPKITNHSYQYKGDTYTYPTREVVRKGVKKVERRKLLPTLAAIADYLRKSPQHQIDRQTRNKPAGGLRTPKKTSLKPIIPKARPLDMLFLDSFRMPVTVHRGKQVSWVIVIVDALTRMIYLAPMYLQTSLSTSLKDKGDMEAITEGYDPSKRPSSDQSLKNLKEMIRKINKTRKEYAKKKKLPAPSELHPRLVTCDAGSEFRGYFEKGVMRLRETHKKTEKGKTIYPFYNITRVVGRSNHNALAENSVRHVRKYFYSINIAYQRAVEEYNETHKRKIPKKWIPDRWHVGTQSTELYDWVLDVDEVMRRVNTRYETTIKTQPIKALLQLDTTYKTTHQRIVDKAKRTMRDVKHNLFLPGFSPKEEPKAGDYVRIRIHKEGNMSVTWPQKGSKRKQNTKGASNNWSKLIYKIARVRKLEGGALTYLVTSIDPDERRASRGYLDRTAILKIPEDTVLDSGRTVKSEDKYLNREVTDTESEVEEPARTAPTPVDKLEKMSVKEWAKELRNKQFNWEDDVRTKILRVVDRKYRTGPTKHYGWAVETKDLEDGYLGEVEFEDLFDLIKGEPDYKDEYNEFYSRIFSGEA